MIKLDNGTIYAEISETGAEIRRIAVGGKEKLWCGDEKIWSGTAPVMFPICGGLKDDKFTIDGREYTLSKHGFAKLSVFEVEKSDSTSATFLLTDNKVTLKQYPWHFEFRITYTLTDGDLKVEYNVKNKSDSIMYFSVGSHEAYACPEGIEEYDVVFPQKETLNAYNLDGNLLSHERTPILKDGDTLALKEDYFKTDALVFKDVKSRRATLKNRKTGESITVDFDGCDYLLIWHKYCAKYICVEPWGGIPAMTDAGYEIETKEGITALDIGKDFNLAHTIHFGG